MKRLFLMSLASLAIACYSTNIIAQEQELSKKEQKELQKQQKKEMKERKKKLSEIGSALAFEKAVQCLKEESFVLEADRLQSKNGRISNVASNTNFLSVQNGKAVVQIAPNNYIAGPNGVGGITLDGNVTKSEISEGKSGAVVYSYTVQGIGISATIKIELPAGSAGAIATIYPNYSSNHVKLHGKIVAPQNSRVFKGRAL